jgi:hypothetical protein
MRNLLVLESYCGGLMSHFGVHKTYDMLNEHFFWHHMRRDVEKVCNACVVVEIAYLLWSIGLAGWLILLSVINVMMLLMLLTYSLEKLFIYMVFHAP